MMRLHCSAVDIGVTLAVKPCKREKNYNSLAAAIILLQGRLELNLFLHSLQPCDSLMTTTFCFVQFNYSSVYHTCQTEFVVSNTLFIIVRRLYISPNIARRVEVKLSGLKGFKTVLQPPSQLFKTKLTSLAFTLAFEDVKYLTISYDSLPLFIIIIMIQRGQMSLLIF